MKIFQIATGKWLPVVHTTPCCCALHSFQQVLHFSLCVIAGGGDLLTKQTVVLQLSPHRLLYRAHYSMRYRKVDRTAVVADFNHVTWIS